MTLFLPATYRETDTGKFRIRINPLTALPLVGAWLLFVGNANGQSNDGLARAGCPHQIARYARVGYGSSYVAYYVGGGARASKGEARYCDEGTFGVDYMPIVPGFRRSVVLGWWHGKRQQGGYGQYEPNAPVAPFPNMPGRSDSPPLTTD